MTTPTQAVTTNRPDPGATAVPPRTTQEIPAMDEAEANRRDNDTLYEFLMGRADAPADAPAPAADARPHPAALPWRGTGIPGQRETHRRVIKGLRDYYPVKPSRTKSARRAPARGV
jgi:hypothetical protein